MIYTVVGLGDWDDYDFITIEEIKKKRQFPKYPNYSNLVIGETERNRLQNADRLVKTIVTNRMLKLFP